MKFYIDEEDYEDLKSIMKLPQDADEDATIILRKQPNFVCYDKNYLLSVVPIKEFNKYNFKKRINTKLKEKWNKFVRKFLL